MRRQGCDIIIPVWNEHFFTKRCIESIERSSDYPYRLILIDNNSDSQTAGYLADLAKRRDSVTLIRNDENFGFIKAANQGLKIADSLYLCLMNNDTITTDGWLGRMVSIAESDPKIGLVNPRSEHPGRLSFDAYAKRLSQYKGQYIETNQCMGFCMLIKREVIDRIGYLDEVYGMGGFDDTDFSKKAHLAGYKCVCSKDAYVYHDWHTSFKKAGNREELVKRNEKIFSERWGRYLRIGYPITYRSADGFHRDINTSLGLAREWNWVHAWLGAGRVLKKEIKHLALPEHQSLRLFNMPGVSVFFYLDVLFRLIERALLKKKKSFDVIIVSDKRTYRFLSFFKELLGAPLFYLNNDKFKCADTEEGYIRRAREIAEFIRKAFGITKIQETITKQ